MRATVEVDVCDIDERDLVNAVAHNDALWTKALKERERIEQRRMERDDGKLLAGAIADGLILA